MYAGLVRWFATTSNNVGVIMGEISHNAFAFDFDDPSLARFTFDLEIAASP